MRVTPKGGVIAPIAKLSPIINPKCTGSNPNETTRGTRIGVRIKIIVIVSIKSPKINKRKFIESIMRIGLSVILRKKFVITWGM